MIIEGREEISNTFYAYTDPNKTGVDLFASATSKEEALRKMAFLLADRMSRIQGVMRMREPNG